MRQFNALLTTVLVCAMPFITALHGQTYFSKKFTFGEAGMAVNVLPDGYLMSCNFQGSSVWMIKTDLSGNEIQKRYYENFSCSSPDLTLLDSNRVFIGGIANVNDTVGICVVRLNTNGDTLWTKRYRKQGCGEESSSIIKSHDGNLLIAFRRFNFTTRLRELLVYKMDTSGNLLSEKVLYSLRNQTNWTSMRYENKEYYFSYFYTNETAWSNSDGVIMKTDTNFVTRYYRNIGHKGVFTGDEYNAFFLPMPNKKSVFVWLQDSTNGSWRPYTGQTNTAIFNMDSLGRTEKTHYFYDPGVSSCVRTAISVRRMKNGDIVGVGKLSSSCTNGDFQGWIFRMSPTGRLKWERFITDSLYNPPWSYIWFLDFKETPQNDLIISGLIRGTNPLFNPLLIKVDSNGCFDNRRCDSADVKVSISSINDKQQKIKLFPNPVVNALNIDFDPINGETQAEISLYNLLGSKVGQQKLDLINTPLSINVSNLPSGMYTAVLQIKGRSPAVEKFVIVK
jgi:Secretion system C-terminal sorting domain